MEELDPILAVVLGRPRLGIYKDNSKRMLVHCTIYVYDGTGTKLRK